MTLNTCIQKLFLLKPNEFLNIYFFENEYLFENLKLNQRVYKKMKKILTTKDSLLTYFEKLNGRKIKKKEVVSFPFSGTLHQSKIFLLKEEASGNFHVDFGNPFYVTANILIRNGAHHLCSGMRKVEPDVVSSGKPGFPVLLRGKGKIRHTAFSEHSLQQCSGPQ